MKNIGHIRSYAAVLLLALAPQIPVTGLYGGSVIYIDLSPDEITIAADSRTNGPSGEHEDDECKISAFGSKFVFVMAGIVKGRDWNAHQVAREAWSADSKSIATASELVHQVSDDWAGRMEKIYARPGVVDHLKDFTKGQPVLANAVFAAVDEKGSLVVYAMDLWYSVDVSGSFHFEHGGADRSLNGWISGGYDEIIAEFRRQTSARSKEFMARYLPEISGLGPSERRRALSSKLVELSIQLHPDKAELAFPVDVLQLRRSDGVHWISLKPNCARD